MNWNGFKGAAKRLDNIDLPKLGALIGVGEDEVHAVLEVESRGSGFDAQGRPAMLFEPHIFWRELGPGKKRDQAAALGLAYPKWQSGNYPRDSYPRLIKAMAIDETAALRSASWGLGQIMGNNHKLAGFQTPQGMVKAFMDDEESHLTAMINFIKSAKLDDDLRAHDWAGFARGYNGSGYAKHGYHIRLRRAFEKWSKIRNTPYDPKMDVRESAATETAIRDPHAGHVRFDPATPKPPETAPNTRPDAVPLPAKPTGFWAWLASLFTTTKGD